MPIGGKFTLLDSGKLGIRASGKTDVCDDCCACALCDGTTSIQVTLAGVDASMCDTCFFSGSDYWTWTSVAVDGTYNIGVSGAGCRYEETFSISSAATRKRFPNSSCTTPNLTQVVDDIRIEVNRLDDDYFGTIRVDFGSVISGFFFVGPPSGTVLHECLSTPQVVSNDQSCSSSRASDGGTMTIEFV